MILIACAQGKHSCLTGLNLQLDDPLDAIAVHCWNGTWGVIAVGFLAGQGLVTQSYGLDQNGNQRQWGCWMGGNGRLLGAQLIYAFWLAGKFCYSSLCLYTLHLCHPYFGGSDWKLVQLGSTEPGWNSHNVEGKTSWTHLHAMQNSRRSILISGTTVYDCSLVDTINCTLTLFRSKHSVSCPVTLSKTLNASTASAGSCCVVLS